MIFLWFLMLLSLPVTREHNLPGTAPGKRKGLFRNQFKKIKGTSSRLFSSWETFMVPQTGIFLVVCKRILIWVSPFRTVFNLLLQAETGISLWVIFQGVCVHAPAISQQSVQGGHFIFCCRKQYRKSGMFDGAFL